jgi:hypothetical protein
MDPKLVIPMPEKIIPLAIQDVLSPENYKIILETIEKEKIKDNRFGNERKTYANTNLFAYSEVNIKGVPTIVLEYAKKRYVLPWQCNSNLLVYKLVIDELVKVIKPVPSESEAPKPDTTDFI